MATILPMDIISTHILPRLPTKSLIRFKCVSKSFNTLISSQHFINLHSLTYKQPNKTLFVAGINSTLYSLNLDSLHPTPVQFPLSGFFTPVPNSTFEVIGSCNGLLCLASVCYWSKKYPTHYERIVTFNSLVLLNPFTRNFREIPFHYLPDKLGDVGLGFGFDDVNNDYKIVSLVDLPNKYTVVYSLNANTWKFVPHRISSRERLEFHSWSVCVNNCLVHFLFFGDYNCRIGCFDLRTDEWTQNVPLPECDPLPRNFVVDGIRYFGDYPVCLRVLDGCLCFGDLRDRKCVDVWIMKEYGVKESWELFRVSLMGVGRNVKTLEMITYREGEILLKKRGVSHLIFVFNIRDRRVSKVALNGIAGFSQGYECKESLVQVPGGTRTEPPQNVGLTDEMQVLICELPPWLF